MVEKTLTQMRLGGIYDQLGFGFHRYSTDAQWLVPHFEKMLYDQAMLIMAYTEAYQTTGKVFYAGVAEEIITYVLRDMTSAEGGFFSAEDADSEGIEGKFYLWTPREIQKFIGEKEAALFVKVFNVKEGSNFEDAGPGHNVDQNILHLQKPLAQLSEELGVSENQLRTRLEAGRLKLFREREKRNHPFKDDKILTDWNGLMIAALGKPFLPQKVALFRPADNEAAAEVTGIAPFTLPMAAKNGRATAYVCREFACKLPTTRIDQMLENLRQD